MGERGAGRTFRPKYRLSKKHPWKQCKTWHYAFGWRGKRYFGYGGKTREEARLALEARKREVGAGVHADPRKTTFAELLTILEDDYKVHHPEGRVRLEQVLAHVRPFFAPYFAADINRPLLVKYVAHRQEEGAAAATINLELRHIRRAFNLGREARKCSEVVKVPTLPETPRQGYFLPHEEERLLAALPYWWRPAIKFARITSWRMRSEILTREWRHVDFGPPAWYCRCGRSVSGPSCEGCHAIKPGSVRLLVGEAKNKKGRAFPMTTALRFLLEDQRAYVDDLEKKLGQVIPWVFPQPNGRRLKDPRSVWREAVLRAGLEGKHPHDFRRTAIMEWERAGLSRTASMALSGHSKESIFAAYSVYDERAQRTAVEQLERMSPSTKVEPIKKKEG